MLPNVHSSFTFLTYYLSRKLVKTDRVCAPESMIQQCLQLNISQCQISEVSDEFTVTVYNPLSHIVSHYVRLPVLGSAYNVIDPLGKKSTKYSTQMI